MTIVFARNFINDITIVADTRISYPNGGYHDDWGLIKLIPIHFNGRPVTAVLGFCGTIDSAYKILSYVLEKKLKNYCSNKGPIVIVDLAEKLARWISEAAADVEDVDNKFIFCAFELLRRPITLHGQPFIKPFFDAYIYKYELGSNGQYIGEHCPQFVAIGSGHTQKDFMNYAAHVYQDFGQGLNHINPEMEFVRSWVFTETITTLFRKMHPDYRIGGPYQVIRLRPYQPATIDFLWMKDEKSPFFEARVSYELDKGRINLTNPTMKKNCTLTFLLDWKVSGNSSAMA